MNAKGANREFNIEDCDCHLAACLRLVQDSAQVIDFFQVIVQVSVKMQYIESGGSDTGSVSHARLLFQQKTEIRYKCLN